MSELHVVGQAKKRVDAHAKVTGSVLFTADLRQKDMLFAGVLFAGHPHANIKNLDISKAQALPGVVTVMTAKDLPGVNAYGLFAADKPVIADVKTRYEGDPVAILAAETEEIAREAVKLIEVEYEPLPIYDDPREAMKDDAVLIHENHPEAEKGNILGIVRLNHGDVEQAFKDSTFIIENDFETPIVEHCYLEQDVCVAIPDGLTGGLTLISPNQAVYATKRKLAPVFNIPQNKLHVKSPLVGGGFGGKDDSVLDVSVIAGVLALKTKRTVYFELSREEVFRTTGKRHATYVHHRLCADKNGKITGIDVKFVLDKGAYTSLGGIKSPFHAVTMRTAMYSGGTYSIPNAKVRSYSVFTNHPYANAFRGFGAPQAHFALECQMDELARKVGVSPIEIRRRNMLKHNDRLITDQVVLKSRGLGLEECLEKTLKQLSWDDDLCSSEKNLTPNNNQIFQSAIKKGRGIAMFMYGTGVPIPSEGATILATVQLDGTLNINTASTEMGQGLTTALAQIAAEAMGIRFDDVLVDISDTARAPDSGSTVGSRSAVIVGNAVLDACKKLKTSLLQVASTKFFHNVGPENITIHNGMVYEEGKPEASYPFSKLVTLMFNSQIPLTATGSWFPPPATFTHENGQGNTCHAYTFGVQGIELEVDTETGVITILRSVIACDVGKAINPDNVIAQMEGGVAQAIGWSIMEETLMEAGVMQNPTFHNYMIPTVMDLPTLESIIVEHPNELGPFGAKGIGEPAIIGAAPAIRNALCNALGFSINTIPLTAKNVLAAIKKNNQTKEV